MFKKNLIWLKCMCGELFEVFLVLQALMQYKCKYFNI